MCVDYRRLNAISDADAYQMPRVDDMIDALGKAKYITTLDLACGYWQVPVRRVTTPNRLCHPLRTIPIPSDAVRTSRSTRYLPAHDGPQRTWMMWSFTAPPGRTTSVTSATCCRGSGGRGSRSDRRNVSSAWTVACI